VLEFKTPDGHDWAALASLGPKFWPYLLSFIFLGIYWSNHHHMIHLTGRVTGGILWANLHLLFWLSLVPFTTAWMGDSRLAPMPTAIYGFVLMLAGVAYYLLQETIIRADGPGSPLKAAIGSDRKGILSVVMYTAAVPIAFFHTWIAAGIYIAVALVWLVPDSRIERRIRVE
jgi:uncharacterized membrane protein